MSKRGDYIKKKLKEQGFGPKLIHQIDSENLGEFSFKAYKNQMLIILKDVTDEPTHDVIGAAQRVSFLKTKVSQLAEIYRELEGFKDLLIANQAKLSQMYKDAKDDLISKANDSDSKTE